MTTNCNSCRSIATYSDCLDCSEFVEVPRKIKHSQTCNVSSDLQTLCDDCLVKILDEMEDFYFRRAIS